MAGKAAFMVHRSRDRRAFTLIEVLVGIGILATLVALLAPAVSRAVIAARIAKCRHNLHGIGVAIQMYLTTSDGIMPAACQMPSLELSDEPCIASALGPAVDDPELFHCPADVRENYFAREGTSYEYHTILGGREVGDSFLTRRWGEANTPVMNDYKPYHGPPGQVGSTNYLFADGHVGDLGG